jgi:serine/threonine-protein kinase
MDTTRPWSVPGYGEVAELGTGTSGRVVAAVHRSGGRHVAIKYLAPELAADQAFASRFRAEAHLLADLRDPHVVAFHEYVEGPGTAAIVMELVEGPSLRVLLDRLGPTTPEAALVVLHGSLLGLGAAHRVGVVHRDYKPGNILVQADGTSLLGDLGIAVPAGAEVAVAGTPAYMAPEQWRGTVGPPADVYAATVVFFECLTGHRPFYGMTTQELAAAHAMGRIPVEEVPGPLQILIEHGMAKDPVDRPMTAELFAAELERVATRAYGEDWRRAGLLALAAGVSAVAPLLITGSMGAPVRASGSALGSRVASFAGTRMGVGVFSTAALAIVALGAFVAVQIGVHAKPVAHLHPVPRPAATVSADSGRPPATPVARPAAGARSSRPPALVTVPDTAGMPASPAVSLIDGRGLDAVEIHQTSSSVAAGLVIGTSPAAGTEVSAGDTVDVYVSTGSGHSTPSAVTLPLLTGENYRTAEAWLSSHGLHASIAYVTTNDAGPGIVTATDPAGGTSVPAGSTVTLDVARAPRTPPSSPPPTRKTLPPIRNTPSTRPPPIG